MKRAPERNRVKRLLCGVHCGGRKKGKKFRFEEIGKKKGQIQSNWQ